MRIFMTGATGFIGRALVPRLQADGHTVVVWARSGTRARNLLGADVEVVSADGGTLAMRDAISTCEAVINLAGEAIVGKRWTAARRLVLERSRVDLTRDLVAAVTAATPRPCVLVSGSAVGFYGDRADEILTERSAPGNDFLAVLCQRWEAAAREAEPLGVRVVLLRTGVVLGRAGGALAQMLPPFKVGVGGRLASGRQYMPWIHLHDLVKIIVVALTDSRLSGPINGVAPEEATNDAFTRELARLLHRPAVLPVPALALRAIFGEAAVVLLGSQRARPAALQTAGFVWEFPQLDAALDQIVSDRAAVIAPPDARTNGGRDASYELRTTTTVDAPLERTFTFFSKAENLGLITPAPMNFTLQRAPATIGVGTLIDYRIKIGPVPIRWRTRIDEWEPGRRFVDVQAAGPYRLWRHEHVFRADGGRTVVEDRVWYTPPFGFFGRLANRLFIAPALRAIFQYREDVIRLRFAPRQAA